MKEHDQTFKTNTDVVVTPLEGEKESVLLHLGTKKYYTLNETGVLIWELLSEGLTIGETTQKICTEYDVSPTVAAKSISTLISSLVKEDLLLAE